MKSFFVLGTILCSPPLRAQVDLSEYAELHAGSFLSEAKGPASLTEALQVQTWEKLSRDDPNYGMTSDVIWFSGEVFSNEPTTRVFYIEDYLMDLEIYVVRDGVVTQTHDLSFAKRAAAGERFRVIAQAVRLPAGHSRLLLRASSTRSSLWFPLEVHTESSFQQVRDRSNVVFGILFGALIMIAVVNFLVGVSGAQTSFRSYVIYVIAALFYLTSISGFLFQHLPFLSPFWTERTNGVAGALLIAMTAVFARSFLATRQNDPWIDGILYIPILASLVSLVWLFLPDSSISANSTFRSYVGIFVVTLIFIAGVRAWHRGFVPARYFVLAFGAFFTGTSIYLLTTLGFLPRIFLFSRAIQLGTVIQMALLSLALSDRINSLRRALESHTRELEKAHKNLAASERKYRTIVENTSDVIVSLDEENRITAVSSAVSDALGYQPKTLIGTLLEDLFFRSKAASLPMEAMMFRDAVRGLGSTPAEMRIGLKTRHGERVLMHLRLEKIAGADGAQVLGKISPLIEDELAQFLQLERGRYYITSHLTLSHRLNERITRNLIRYVSSDDAELIRLCVREMIINAIEHGNLGISFEEKTKAQAEDNYIEFVVNRENRPEYRDRRLHVDYLIGPDRCVFRITDEGDGFDVNRLTTSQYPVQDLKLGHGRGISMARMVFDRVVYNAKGNQVTLVKNFKMGSSSENRKA